MRAFIKLVWLGLGILWILPRCILIVAKLKRGERQWQQRKEAERLDRVRNPGKYRLR